MANDALPGRPAWLRAASRRQPDDHLRPRGAARLRCRRSPLIVDNNYGYDLQKFNDFIPGPTPLGGDRGLVSSPGMARVDIRAGGCRKAWTNTQVRAPSVVPKGDVRNGLIYTYENLKDPRVADSDPWAWTALDARTGKVRFRRLSGYGGLYNNHYAGIALGRTGTLYMGGVGGVMALRDR